MELQAVIEALNALKEPCEIEFYTDSEYVKNGVTKWLATWKRNGWRTKAKQVVKNEDLWRAVDSSVSNHQVEWRWLKGRAGHVGNERCDQLAVEEIAKIRKRFKPEQLSNMLAQFSAKDELQPAMGELF
jgi:ribonuclease HI